jgi:hypothetical protein
MLLVRMLVLFICTLAVYSQDLPLTCTPAKPVVTEGEAIQVRVWAPPGNWAFEWHANAGQLDVHGENAVWDFTEVMPGPKTITVEARGTSPPPACHAEIFVEKRVAHKGDRMTRRFLLPRRATESKSYGLYSYVLLTPDGGDKAAEQRNGSALENWYKKILPVAELERSVPTAKLNATFVPVDNTPTKDPALAWIVQHYDFQRADQLLFAIMGAHTHGPYLVSSQAPLQPNYRGRLLVLDASWAPPSTIRFWIDEFLNQAAQERFDKPSSLDLFNLKLRTIISVLAQGQIFARDALKSIIMTTKR